MANDWATKAKVNNETVKSFAKYSGANASALTRENITTTIPNAVRIDDNDPEHAGVLYGWTDSENKFNYWTDAEKLYLPEDSSLLFNTFTAMTTLNLKEFDSSKVTNMSFMFQRCTSLANLDLSNFDTSKVKDMVSTFDGMIALSGIDLSSFNTSNVETMPYLFYEDLSLASVDLSSFSTSKVTDMSYMFYDAINLANIYVSDHWNTAAVSDSTNMFGNAEKLPNFNASTVDKTGADTAHYLKAKAYNPADPKPEGAGGESSDTTMTLPADQNQYSCDAAGESCTINITDNKQGAHAVQLTRNGDSWVYNIKVVDDKVQYFVYESDLVGYKVSNTATNPVATENKQATITNTSEDQPRPNSTKTLKISKTVKGQVTYDDSGNPSFQELTGPAPSNKFIFHITLSGKDISGVQRFGNVVFDEGKATVRLAHNESISLDGIPSTAKYDIVEEKTKGFIAEKEQQTGRMPAKRTSVSVKFVNGQEQTEEPKYVDLKVEKKLSGNFEKTDDQYQVNLAFTDLEAEKEYTIENSVSGDKANMTKFMSDAQGVANISLKLKKDQIITVKQIPVGTLYQATELAGSYAASYKLTDAAGAGSISSTAGFAKEGEQLATKQEKAEENEQVTITFDNKLNKTANLQLTKRVLDKDGQVVAGDATEYIVDIHLANLAPNAKIYSSIGVIQADASGRAMVSALLSSVKPVTINNLPVGATYYLTEQKSDKIASYVITDSANLGKIKKATGANTKTNQALSTDTETVNEGENVTVSFTNKAAPELINVNVSKEFNDADNQDGKRPSSVFVQLYELVAGQKTAIGDKIKLDASNKWHYTWSNLDAANTYGVEELYTSPIYTATVSGDQKSGFKITNSYNPETINIPVEKTWNDASDQDGIRPESVTVKLFSKTDAKAEPKDTGLEINIKKDAKGAYKGIFTGVPKYEAGKKLIYSVKETPVAGYNNTENKLVNADNQEQGFTLTNSRTDYETVDVSGTKTWNDNNNQDGKRPAKLTVQLLADGKPVQGKVVTLEGKNLSYEWKGLPKNKAGKAIVYSVSEDANGDAEGDGLAALGYSSKLEGYNLINTYNPENMSIPVTKIWNDNDNKDGKRPQKVVLRLFAKVNGVEQDTNKTLELSQDQKGEYKGSFDGLAKYSNGNKIQYIVKEDAVAGYDQVEVKNVDDKDQSKGIQITNTHTNITVDIQATKVWNDGNNQDGKRPLNDAVTLRLFADGQDTKKTLVVSKSDNYKGSFTKLDKYKAGAVGQEINYSIKEDKVDDYETSVKYLGEKNLVKSFTITNTHTPATINVAGTKTWNDNNNQDGKRPAALLVQLMANGVAVAGKSKTLNDNDLSYSWNNLPKYSQGVEISYTIKEDANGDAEGDGLAALGYTGEAKGYNLVNTYKAEQTSIGVTKIWNDNNNQDGKRPANDEVTVRLIANGVDTGKSLKLNKANAGKARFENLDVYKAGQKINYEVKEDAVPAYKSDVIGDSASGFTVINTHTSETLAQINFKKIWQDEDNKYNARPDQIKVYLLANGSKVQEVTVGKPWLGKFTNLAKYQNGKLIHYSLAEETVKGYDANISGDAAGGFTITNTYNVPAPQPEEKPKPQETQKSPNTFQANPAIIFTILGSVISLITFSFIRIRRI